MPAPERLTFQPSSYTGGGSNCLEAASHQDGVVIRDSKDPSGPTIEFTHPQWARFLEETRQSHATKHHQPSTNNAVSTTTEKLELIYNGETKLTCWHLNALASDTALHFTAGEKEAFILGIEDGEFTYPQTPSARRNLMFRE
jgi:hypothetical protein